VNDIPLGTNGFRDDERPTKAAEQHPGHGAALAVDLASSAARRAGRSWLPTLALIFGFWLVWYVAWSTYGWLNFGRDNIKYLLPRAVVAASGAVISVAIAAVLRAMRGSPMSARALAALALSLAATVTHGVVAQEIWLAFKAMDPATSPFWVMWITDFINRFWFFASQSGLILALSYAADVREREERIHALQALAHSAQIRALRNQLNPHFLFNALNSVAGLMRTREPAAAETMVENLGDFLRTTLSLDPQSMITLDEELRLQELYLSIEKVRFPDRLHIEVSVPAELEKAMVPSLVTQPLIENSIKYAVARSTEKVTLRVAAERLGNSVILTVADDGGNADPVTSASSHLGLRNISQRLAVHFGDEASLESHPLEGRGYINRLTLPLSVAS